MNHVNFKRVMDQIRKDPKTWEQGSYAAPIYAPGANAKPCGTAYCVAGWGMVMQAVDAGQSVPTYSDMKDMTCAEIVRRAGEFFSVECDGPRPDLPWVYGSARSLDDLEAVERGERDFLTGLRESETGKVSDVHFDQDVDHGDDEVYVL